MLAPSQASVYLVLAGSEILNADVTTTPTVEVRNHRTDDGEAVDLFRDYRYGSSQDDARSKLEYDPYYVNRMSLLLAIRIILRTVQVMFELKGR